MNTLQNTSWTEKAALNFLRLIQNIPGFAGFEERYLELNARQKICFLAAVALVGVAIVTGLLRIFFGPVIAAGFVASTLAGLATGLGALPALFFRAVPVKIFNTMLGGAAGVMLAATAFSLIVPGMTFGDQMWPGKGMIAVAVGMIIGGIFLDLADRRMPHVHFLKPHELEETPIRKLWLFIVAITIHNFPEGLAVGVSFGSGDMHNGIALAIAIGLQNIPEGMAVAFPLIALGYSPAKSVWIGTLTGLVEPIGGLLGVVAVSLFSPVLPVAMGFAAGAMLFVISEEIIPETQSKGKARHATYAVLIGFIVMMGLDNMLR